MEVCCSDTDSRKLSVVIPVYNSSSVLEELAVRLMNTLSKMNCQFEIIFVEDGSHDGSWEKIKQIKERYPSFIKGILLSKNYGQHNATLCGFAHATVSENDIIVTIDDDLEFQPEDIPLLIQKMEETNCDLVYGVPIDKKEKWLKKRLTFVFRKIQQMTEKEMVRGSSFRVIRCKIAKQTLKNQRYFSFIDEFLRWYTRKIQVVLVHTQPSKQPSRYALNGLIKITRSLVYLSSSLPLKLVTWFGFAMMIINFLIGMVIIYNRLVLTIDVKGYTSIIVTLLFSFGLLIFVMGIIAEYIGQILKMNYNKPSYFEVEEI